ncbi:CLUMA_CG010425, isoform A [Clunio marinus]|uniref:CLUMA_CG010425, isoform A n=1 Tax=Clunio marinus TaxID=568069 RepID=A0A1J1IBS6_9DIPT|nr:CLUMA_CG010425, isoform A [Clunio marinus]
MSCEDSERKISIELSEQEINFTLIKHLRCLEFFLIEQHNTISSSFLANFHFIIITFIMTF